MRARSFGLLVVSVLLVTGLSRPAFGAASCTTFDAQNLPTATFRGGEKVVVRGTGFAPNARVLVSLQQGTRTFELTGADANDLGAFAATDAVIPETVAEGAASIRAVDARGSATCDVTLEAAAEDEDGLGGLFWVWGALLALFAGVLASLTYRRWKAERLKEAAESLAWRGRYRSSEAERAPADPPSDPEPIPAGRPQRTSPRPPAYPAATERPMPPEPRQAPQPFGLRPPGSRRFDESMRTTAPFPDDDADFPIGAPRPFDDRFAVDDRPVRDARSPAAEEGGRRPDRRPPPVVGPRAFQDDDDLFDPVAFDPSAAHDDRAASTRREPARRFRDPEIGDTRDRVDMPAFVDTDAPAPPRPPVPVDEGPDVAEPSALDRPRVEPRERRAREPGPEPLERQAPSQTVRAPRAPTAPAVPGTQPERSFAQALREFLDSEDELAGPRASAYGPPLVAAPAPSDGPPPLGRRFEPTVRLRPGDDRHVETIPPATSRPQPPHPPAPQLPPEDAGPEARADRAPAAVRRPDVEAAAPAVPHRPVPRAPGRQPEPAESWPAPPASPPQPYRPPLRPEPPDDPDVPRVAVDDASRTAPAEEEEEPYVPEQAPAARVEPRRPMPAVGGDPGGGADQLWQPPRRPAGGTFPAPAVPRGPARPPAAPVRPQRADASLDEPPVLPVGWDDGKLDPPHRRSSEAITRLRREVRDWKR